MSHLYKEINKSVKEKRNIKTDRELFRRIIVSLEAGRNMDMDVMLEKEVHDVPLSLASVDGNFRPTNKAQLLDIVTEGTIHKVISEIGEKI